MPPTQHPRVSAHLTDTAAHLTRTRQCRPTIGATSSADKTGANFAVYDISADCRHRF